MADMRKSQSYGIDSCPNGSNGVIIKKSANEPITILQRPLKYVKIISVGKSLNNSVSNMNSTNRDAIASNNLVTIPASANLIAVPRAAGLPQVVVTKPSTTTTNQTLNQNVNRLNVTSIAENISAEKLKTIIVPKMDNTPIIRTGCQIKMIQQAQQQQQQKVHINNLVETSRTPSPQLKMPIITTITTSTTTTTTTATTTTSNYQINFEDELTKTIIKQKGEEETIKPVAATTTTKEPSSFSSIENRENLTKWSEALAHAKTVQISDSVVLSVVKSGASNKTKLISAVNIKEHQQQQQQQQQQQSVDAKSQAVFLMKTNNQKQESLLKPKSPIDLNNLNLNLNTENDEDVTTTTTTTVKSSGNCEDSPIMSPNLLQNRGAKRSISVNNPPLDDGTIENSLTEDNETNNIDEADEFIDLFDFEKITKKHDMNKTSPERRYSMSKLSEHKRKDKFKDDHLKRQVIEKPQDTATKQQTAVVNVIPTLASLSTAAVVKKTIQSRVDYSVDDEADEDDDGDDEDNVDDDDDDDVIITTKESIPVVNLDSDEEEEDENMLEKYTENMTDEQLLCYENIMLNTSSESNLTANETEETSTKNVKYKNNVDKNELKNTKNPSTTTTSIDLSQEVNTFSTAVNMLSTFNMLNWRDRIGSARGTELRFQLNEFNLLQMYEFDNKRYLSPSVLEVPLYERNENVRLGPVDPAHDLSYTCRVCRCTGHQREFMAPSFCSIKCLSSVNRVRRRGFMEMEAENQFKSSKNRDMRSRLSPSRSSVKTNSNNDNNSNISNQSNSTNNAVTNNNGSLPTFRWAHYLKANKVAAPINLFLNPFPTGPNFFEINMKLEAIDPENCSLFCVCTVVDKAGYRIKLSFDGYDSIYDFWVNADSMDIFPPGWCQKTGRALQPPKGMTASDFNWQKYITNSRAAPRTIFTHLNATSMPSNNPFQIGMHLEAEDLNDTGRLCVATVADVLNDRLRIHFDGWDDCYDYWVDTNSPYIHPLGWNERNQKLVPPPGYTASSFSWKEYIRRKGGMAAPVEYFNARLPIAFKPSMKLEVVDPRIPSFIRPATVIGRKGHRIKVHLDLWPNMYCFWLEDDSPDIHPIGWCDATGHELEPPPGYRTRNCRIPERTHFLGCRNVGNAKNSELSMHFTLEECPYAADNWRSRPTKPKRVANPKQPANINNNNTNNNNMPFPQKNVKNERSSLTGNEEKVVPKLKRRLSEETSNITTKSELKNELLQSNIRVAKEFLCDYGPRLQQSFDLWQHHMSSAGSSNIATSINNIHSNPLGWNTTDVALFVERVLKSNSVANLFLQQDIDGGAFLQLQTNDLTDLLQLSLGPAIKLSAHILQLRAICLYKFQNK